MSARHPGKPSGKNPQASRRAQPAEPRRAEAVPYYAQDADRIAERRMIVRAVDAFGTHLICPRIACRRERRCADEDPRNLPFCARHYRGAIRFAITASATALGVDTSGRAERARYSEVVPAERWRGVSLLARLAEKGVDIARMERPADAGEDRWTWEDDPGALATMAEMRAMARRG